MKNALLVFSFIYAIIGCDNSHTKNKNIASIESLEINMIAIDNKELLKIRRDLLEGMLSYMKNEYVTYSSENVAEAGDIISNHFIKLSKIKNKDDSKALVKDTVIKLNHLNDKTDHQLIETDQRELICEFIIKSGVIYGFNGINEDVTENWREW